MMRSSRRWLPYILFALATVHCARSIFLVNVSLLDLSQYEQGTERMPFQGRVAMMPVLRWAHTNVSLARAAAFLDRSLRNTPHMQQPPEPYTAEKVCVLLLGMLAIGAMVAGSVRYGNRHLGELWWLPGVLTLLILYVTYAARYEMEFWYPYDLPHFAVFGLACLFLIEGELVLFGLCFLLDVPLRETAIFLVPVLLAVGWSRGKWKQAAGMAFVMAAVWLPVQLAVHARYANNPTDAHVHGVSIYRAIANPLHWPQVASAFGFLAIPLFLGRRSLSRTQRFFLLGAVPALLVTALYGIWYETRIWDEWTVPAAILLASECAVLFGREQLQATREA